MGRLKGKHTDLVWFDQDSIDGLNMAIGQCQQTDVAVEFGSWTGTSTQVLAERFGAVCAVDPWQYQAGGPPEYQEVHEAYPVFLERTARFTNLLRFRTSDAEFMRTFDGPADFVFIDAEHTYDPVSKAIMWAREHVRPGGVIAGHDYGHDAFPGVVQAVDEGFGTYAQKYALVWWACV